MIVVFTPVHGRYDLAQKCFESIEQHVPRPFAHFIFDDFSPEPDAKAFWESTGPIFAQGGPNVYPGGSSGAAYWSEHGGENGGPGSTRQCYRASDASRAGSPIMHAEPPNLGAGLLWAWQYARAAENVTGFLSIESDVILRPGCVEALREAEVLHRGGAGAVAPLYTKVGGNSIETFGGCEDRGFMSLSRGQEIGSWHRDAPTIDVLPWAHLACLWIPSYVLAREDIAPDPNFRLYYQDFDLCYQIKRAGFEIIVTDRAVAEHTRANASTGLVWKDESVRSAKEQECYAQLLRKWA